MRALLVGEALVLGHLTGADASERQLALLRLVAARVDELFRSAGGDASRDASRHAFLTVMYNTAQRQAQRWLPVADWQCVDETRLRERVVALAALAAQYQLAVPVLVQQQCVLVCDAPDMFGQRTLVYDGGRVHEFNDNIAGAVQLLVRELGEGGRPLRLQPYDVHTRTPMAVARLHDVPGDGNCFFHAAHTAAEALLDRPARAVAEWPVDAAACRQRAVQLLCEHDLATLSPDDVLRQLMAPSRLPAERQCALDALAPAQPELQQRWLRWAHDDNAAAATFADNPNTRPPPWPAVVCERCGQSSERAGKLHLRTANPAAFDEHRAQRRAARACFEAERLRYESARRDQLQQLMRASQLSDSGALVRRLLDVYATPGFYADDLVFAGVARAYGRALVVWSAHDGRDTVGSSVMPRSVDECARLQVDWRAMPLHVYNAQEAHYGALVPLHAAIERSALLLCTTADGSLRVRSLAGLVTDTGLSSSSSSSICPVCRRTAAL